MELSGEEAILRILVSVFLGSVLGLEREFTQKTAGLRTHILVCLGSAVYTLLSVSDFIQGMDISGFSPDADVRIVRDPARIAAQVVTGIGFIGGGAVLHHGANVKGLTTAASLWVMASIGMLVGTGHYKLSLVTTLLAFLVLFTIGRLERTIFAKNVRANNRMRMLLTVRLMNVQEVQNWLERRFGNSVLEVKSASSNRSETMTLTYVVKTTGLKVDLQDLSRRINMLTGVTSSGIRLYREEDV